MIERGNATHQQSACIALPTGVKEEGGMWGRYDVECWEIIPGFMPAYLALVAEREQKALRFEDTRFIDEQIAAIPRQKVWENCIENTVCTPGKNYLLDNFICASSFSQTGPYVGLISSVGYSAISADDTMGTHSGWTECGTGSNYPVITTRGTPNWAAAASGAKAFSAAVAFTIGATGGTIKGCFLVLGASASATLGSTSGYLLSAGIFTGNDQVVSATNTVNVSYSFGI